MFWIYQAIQLRLGSAYYIFHQLFLFLLYDENPTLLPTLCSVIMLWKWQLIMLMLPP